MYCIKTRFEAYKRLARTSCNTDARILAFVGSNESGKSSMLEGLVWLTNDGAGALPDIYENRSRRGQLSEQGVVVEAIYELEPEDLALLEDLELAETPRTFILQKRKNGVTASGVAPTASRDPAPFELAAGKIDAARRKFHAQFALPLDEEDENSNTAAGLAESALAALRQPDETWSDETAHAVEALAQWLEDKSSTGRGDESRDKEAARLLRIALGKARSQHPQGVARERMLARVPKFVLFSEEDRTLSTVHNIADENARRNPQPALTNLLRIAGLDLDTLWRFIEIGDDSSRETLMDDANETLEEFFSQAWNQARVSVRLKSSGHQVEVYLKELGRGGSVTNIEERSDGLRTFVALAAFLASQEVPVPPVLLIDEAETHLHYDAQADLVGVLLKQVNATQVFYTTHSPGCLPSDLGTGIRLLRRDAGMLNASTIRQDFWTNEEPGFTPLLYAMGASAAAFSACRRAVLAEGAADMVLLPTLIRMATGLDELDYQVAPGLANAHAYEMRVEEVAAQVLYLVDGDAAGDVYQQQLLNAQTDPRRIFSLPEGWASEDLVDREVFSGIVSTLLPDGVTVTAADLPNGQPIVKSLEDWGKRIDVKVPGHVAIAYGLVNRRRDLVLADGAKQALRGLHRSFMSEFERS